MGASARNGVYAYQSIFGAQEGLSSHQLSTPNASFHG